MTKHYLIQEGRDLEIVQGEAPPNQEPGKTGLQRVVLGGYDTRAQAEQRAKMHAAAYPASGLTLKGGSR